ncbi:MAG: type VI secretion system tube protein Hcp, partial [Ectothiorhodospiraceae bacterium]|nr:type VI secretion system tube protein Hcp [Ectothiorhodospiraceae bacterium]
MSIDMKYPGITGGGSDANHRGWLPVMELTWAGARRRITLAPSTRGDRESANAELSELTVTRVMDRATPELANLLERIAMSQRRCGGGLAGGGTGGGGVGGEGGARGWG